MQKKRAREERELCDALRLLNKEKLRELEVDWSDRNFLAALADVVKNGGKPTPMATDRARALLGLT